MIVFAPIPIDNSRTLTIEKARARPRKERRTSDPKIICTRFVDSKGAHTLLNRGKQTNPRSIGEQMNTKTIDVQELIGSLQNEVRILLHLAAKIDRSQLDYRPTPAQRSTIELLRYLS